jgi:hypothetical protein
VNSITSPRNFHSSAKKEDVIDAKNKNTRRGLGEEEEEQKAFL